MGRYGSNFHERILSALQDTVLHHSQSLMARMDHELEMLRKVDKLERRLRLLEGGGVVSVSSTESLAIRLGGVVSGLTYVVHRFGRRAGTPLFSEETPDLFSPYPRHGLTLG